MTVSELCKRLDPMVKEWNERPLTEAYPFVMVDAMVLKVRKGGQVRPQSALIAIGVNMRGYREVLGFCIGDSETYASWSDFFLWLKKRGLRGVDLVVSDQHGRIIWEAPDVETAREMLRRVIDNFGSRAPRATTILEEGFEKR